MSTASFENSTTLYNRMIKLVSPFLYDPGSAMAMLLLSLESGRSGAVWPYRCQQAHSKWPEPAKGPG